MVGFGNNFRNTGGFRTNFRVTGGFRKAGTSPLKRVIVSEFIEASRTFFGFSSYKVGIKL
jgi:hypothetical protein